MIKKFLSNLFCYLWKLSEISKKNKSIKILFWHFQEREILNTLMVPAKVFLALISTIEDHYVKDNPFHNSMHAADVTQSTNVLLNTPALENVFTPLEICAALFAACVHDVDHPGLTNQFLINSSKFRQTFPSHDWSTFSSPQAPNWQLCIMMNLCWKITT